MNPHNLVWIVGGAYSGSSLLCVLLDRIRGMVGVGEGARRYNPGGMTGPCATCGQKHAIDCEVYSEWQASEWVDFEPTDPAVATAIERGHTMRDDNLIRIGESFYEFCFRVYGCPFLVDSTKDPTVMMQQMQEGRHYPIRVVFLSKSPSEAFASYRLHPPGYDARDCVREWYRVNLYFLGFCAINNLSVLPVRYRDLALHPKETVAKICRFVGHACELREDPNTPRGHLLGGNPSVSSVVSGSDALAMPNYTRETYMGGKYSDVDPAGGLRLTYDSSWLQMPERFRMECQQELDKEASRYAGLLQLLGYGSDELRVLE